MLNSHHFGHWIVLISPAWHECMTRYRTTNIASAFQPGGWCSDPPCTCYDHEWWSCSKASYFQIMIHKVNQKGFPVQYLPVTHWQPLSAWPSRMYTVGSGILSSNRTWVPCWSTTHKESQIKLLFKTPLILKLSAWVP